MKFPLAPSPTAMPLELIWFERLRTTRAGMLGHNAAISFVCVQRLPDALRDAELDLRISGQSVFREKLGVLHDDWKLWRYALINTWAAGVDRETYSTRCTHCGRGGSEEREKAGEYVQDILDKLAQMFPASVLHTPILVPRNDCIEDVVVCPDGSRFSARTFFPAGFFADSMPALEGLELAYYGWVEKDIHS